MTRELLYLGPLSSGSVINRFEGKDGLRRLTAALKSQELVGGDQDVATRLAQTAQLRVFPPGSAITTQGDFDNALFFVCAGEVSVKVHGREVARRGPGEHVGEMAILDVAAPRSATLHALQSTIAAEVSEPDFQAVARDAPWVWHSMARILAARLRERETWVSPRVEQPELFIGSSAEALTVARGVQEILAHDALVCRIWSDDVFKPTRSAMESLEEQLRHTDFALLILSADDLVSSRGRRSRVPRDNVVFELGLFCGVLGRGRTLMLAPRAVPLKLPSDLFGLTVLDYPVGDDSTLLTRLGPACSAIRRAVAALGAR